MLNLMMLNYIHSLLQFEKRIGDELKHFSGAIEPNKFSPSLVVVAENGTVEIEMQDWPASLGVKLRS